MKAQRITKEELRAKIAKNKDLAIIDVRNSSDYAASEVRIPGAVRIPVEELEMRIDELDPGKAVVAYCT